MHLTVILLKCKVFVVVSSSQPLCLILSAAGGRGRVSGRHHRQPDQLSSLRDPRHEQERR